MKGDVAGLVNVTAALVGRAAADELGKETGSGVQHNVPLAGAKRVVHYLPWAPGRSS